MSGNSVNRDAGMLAYISINGAAAAAAAGSSSAVANPDTYNSLVATQSLTVSDPSKGVIANDKNVYGVTLLTPAANGTVTLNANGTFTYVPKGSATTDSFVYCANGSVTGGICSSGLTATVTLGAATIEAATGITWNGGLTFTANTATYLAVKTPGLLTGAVDGQGFPLKVATSTLAASGGVTVNADGNGGFTAVAPGAGTYTLTFQAQNSQGTRSSPTTATLVFPAGSGLKVTVLDGSDHKTVIPDYRWVIEEDRTFYVDPTLSTNTGSNIVPTLGVNFHTSYMPFVAQGCTGPLSCESGQSVQGVPAVCDVSNGVCRTNATQKTAVDPSQVQLDPTKRYYISVLPGDAANPFASGYAGAPVCAPTPTTTCGHGMGGAPIGIDPNTHLQASAVTVLTQPAPFPTAKLSVFVYEDDFPLNGEQDGGGGGLGNASVAPNEPGLGGFQIHLWDAMGQNGDFSGQMTYDMFNQPLSNALDGTPDPNNKGINACPISAQAQGITGMIVTCPKYEADGVTLSPLAGQAVIANLMPGRFGVIATPAADRIARGEEWLQTNTLDGQKAHDAFARISEPSYFQEFGPASFHVSIGFANPAIINARHQGVCDGTDINITGPGCTWNGTSGTGDTIIGRVVGEHLSRTPDERMYGSGSHDAFYWTQCFVSFGDPDGEDFAFTKCNADGTFMLTGLPGGTWRVTTFDQWNDQLVDGLSTPVGLGGQRSNCPGPKTSATVCDMGDIAATQWQTNLYTRTFIDDNKDGISQKDESGIPLANVAVRMRDGSLENLIVTDFTGTANFNETFPLFSWYTVETDVTRYKNTGTHVVYDVGGPTDGSPSCGTPGYPPCGGSTIGQFLANTAEQISLPANLRIPGAVYCAGADCSGKSIQNGPGNSDPSNCSVSGGAVTCSANSTLSSGRIDPPWLGGVEGWQGFPGQNNFIEFGKEPYVAGENGGIKGHVVYASTRPFDDPQWLVQTQWEPLVPHVTINLYQEGVAADGITPTLTLVDTTQTSSWDDYAQGFRVAADGSTVPNMNCPGQGGSTGPLADLFYFSLFNQPDYLDAYNHQHSGTPAHPLPYNSQFKCYDGMHNWNQLQPAPYDGMYQFPSVTSTDPVTGKPTATNCTVCKANNQTASTLPPTDLYYGLPQLPPGKYVVEVVVPPGFELVKEEDKNILIGDSFIAPVTQQFGALGNIFIIPDQASVGAAYNAYNLQNPTNSLGASPTAGIVPSFTPEPTWPCVGASRIVPDYISLYPATKQVAPFAGAKRNLCDRKEVTLGDQMAATAKFYLYTSTHLASKFTGGITDDYTSEFDPFSPVFGEKFAPPDLPVAVKDWAGNETNRVYADHWGAYNGMTYSTWEVNPPNPTGYSPTMMTFCMNDPGPILDTRIGSATNGSMIKDPAYTPGYSQFCYELPFMPGTTEYLDTPVVPTSAFAGAGYNNVDCAYPDATPAVAAVLNSNAETSGGTTLAALQGPWVSAAGHSLTITALGDKAVPNNAYSGPSATTAPFNLKTIMRHYGFGSQCTNPSSESSACNTASTVTIGGQAAAITSWSDTAITVNVPINVPDCAVQQQAQYGGSAAQCGELTITAGNGTQSIDAVTVTVGGKTPTVLKSADPLTQYSTGAIQNAIDAAAPGDLIIVPPGTYQEMLLMWKPVRLQGVGAASSVINANTHPAGKLDPWRREVNCLFGLGLDGTPISNVHAYDPTGTYKCGPGSNGADFTGTPTTLAYFSPTTLTDGTLSPQIDRLPFEATIGWDANLNGNLAEQLQEPSLMGALEGAGITVLSKGVTFASNPYASDAFPTGTTLLGAGNCGDGSASNPFPSNFWCNPSRIDGLSITDSSQGGGGIFVHAWGHRLEIANNRVKNNAGTVSGGINIGQGEFPPAYVSKDPQNSAPGSCDNDHPANVVLPYCHNMYVNVHHNSVSLNSSTGDELFSATPAGAGGVSFCTGADYYKFNYNWVCGNLSSGDGGGVGHMGFSYFGDIEHNTIVFNQSLNPTIPANGGGMIIMGAPDADPPCSILTDADCVGAPNLIGPSDGVGPGLVINANLIMGNAAEAGTGGGIAFQHINGSDVIAFPTTPAMWNAPRVTNNIIADNVAGWDGGGISMLDALKIDIVNNTIISNSTTATAGVLFNTLGAPLASQQGPTCTTNCGVTSAPQPAGIVTVGNSAVLMANFPATGIVCPDGHYAPGTAAANGTCTKVGYPKLDNNVIWQNSAYYIGVGALTPAFQQNVITLYNAFTNTPAPTQSNVDSTTPNGAGVIISGGTGACTAASYWDIGVRGDSGPGKPESGTALAPVYSLLTNPSENGAGSNNLLGVNPTVVSQYCDGSRQPPEFAQSGWAVPPGISDATVPNPVFNLTPVATVDEGNNWVNLRWGPLSTTNAAVAGGAYGNYGGGAALANYDLAEGSPAIAYIPATAPTYAEAPDTDFHGYPRKGNGTVDAGAVEFNPAAATPEVQGGPLEFGAAAGAGSIRTLTLRNQGTTALTGINIVVTAPFALVQNGAAPLAQRPAAAFAPNRGAEGRACSTTLAPRARCTIRIEFLPTAPGPVKGTVTITANVPVAGSPVALSGTGPKPLISARINPTEHEFGSAKRGTTGQVRIFTVRNTGNVPLTGIGHGTLGGTNARDWRVFPQLSNCGPAGGGQFLSMTTLPPGRSCIVAVQFRPRAGETAGAKSAKVSVTDLAGTQTATLKGHAR
ncbi:MAG: hypothetical protein NVSMB15_00520 [Steroidobacteraceae bacterium]